MNQAWGRRIYDQYEMEVEIEKPKNSYLTKARAKQAGCLTKKSELRELGVWDVIFDRAIIGDLQGDYFAIILRLQYLINELWKV